MTTQTQVRSTYEALKLALEKAFELGKKFCEPTNSNYFHANVNGELARLIERTQEALAQPEQGMSALDFTGEVRDVNAWRLDHSAGTPILVYKNCSVIEADDAEYVLDLIKADAQPKEPEQDTCKRCNGNGVVGNILDTDTCPFCKGSGIEAQPEQEPLTRIAELEETVRQLNHALREATEAPTFMGEPVSAEPIARIKGFDEYGPLLDWYKHWVNLQVGTRFYTTPPQRKECEKCSRNSD